MTWTPSEAEWQDMRGSVRRLAEDQAEDRKLLREVHMAIVGSTREPGIAETQRKHEERLDRQDRRLTYHQAAIEKTEGEVAELQVAPVRAAAAAHEGEQAVVRDRRESLLRETAKTIIASIVGGAITLGGLLWALLAGVLRLAQNPPPGPHP